MAITLKDILKLQLQGLSHLDIDTARNLEPVLKLAHKELELSLNNYEYSDYQYTKKRQTQFLISQTLRRLEVDAWETLQKSALEYSELGNFVADQEVNTMNDEVSVVTPDLNKEVTSLEQNKFLLNTAKASLNTYTAGVRFQVSNALTQAVIQKKNPYEVKSKIKTFLKIKEYRIQRIVRTELARIYNSSKLIAYNEFQKDFPDLKKRLYHPIDDRTSEDSLQLAKLDPAIPLNEKFVFIYKRRLSSGKVINEKRVFLVPPDRPNDRASMIPFRDEWKE